MILILLTIIGAYLLGSIPAGMLLARRFAGIDVKKGGSGNIGAANVSRLAGRKLGAITLFFDAAKGMIPVLVMHCFVLPSNQSAESTCFIHAYSVWPFILPTWCCAITGIAAFLGHCFPPWLRFNGGKGVATALGVMIIISPLAAIFGILAFIAVLIRFKVAAAASLAGVIVSFPVAFFSGSWIPGLTALFFMIVIIIRHRENIKSMSVISGAKKS